MLRSAADKFSLDQKNSNFGHSSIALLKTFLTLHLFAAQNVS